MFRHELSNVIAQLNIYACEAGGNGRGELKIQPPHFPCRPVILECSWKIMQIERQLLIDFHLWKFNNTLIAPIS